jgi:hypothetical protein
MKEDELRRIANLGCETSKLSIPPRVEPTTLHPRKPLSYLPGIARSISALKGTGPNATQTNSRSLFSSPARKPLVGCWQLMLQS